MFRLASLPLIALVVCFGEVCTFAGARWIRRNLQLSQCCNVKSIRRFVDAETADPGTATLPETGVPDAIAFFPLTARTSVGRDIISRSDQYVIKGAVNNTARLPSRVRADNAPDCKFRCSDFKTYYTDLTA